MPLRKPLGENQGRDEIQISKFIRGTIAYLNKNHKFQGQNSLRGETVID